MFTFLFLHLIRPLFLQLSLQVGTEVGDGAAIAPFAAAIPCVSREAMNGV